MSYADQSHHPIDIDKEREVSGYNIAYMRVSTVDQKTDRQLADTKITFDQVYTDKCSGKSTDRPELKRMLEALLHRGDTIHVHSIDRMARNLQDLEKLVDTINGKGVTLRFHKEQLTFSPTENTAMNRLLLQVMGAFAQFERSLIKERQREGILERQAKDKGLPPQHEDRAYKGRQAKYSYKQIKAALDKHDGNKSAAAKELGVSYRTVLRAVKQAEQTPPPNQ